jgi:FtsH-binding integral membrane protein
LKSQHENVKLPGEIPLFIKTHFQNNLIIIFFANAIINPKHMDPLANTQSPEEKPQSRRLSAWRIATIFCLFWYALLGWLRFAAARSYQSYFTELHVWPNATYIIASGLAIGVGFSLALVLVILRVKFTPIYMHLLGILFLAWLWFDHTWLGTRTAFYTQAAISILITLITLTVMFVLVRKEDYIQETPDERQ